MEDEVNSILLTFNVIVANEYSIPYISSIGEVFVPEPVWRNLMVSRDTDLWFKGQYASKRLSINRDPCDLGSLSAPKRVVFLAKTLSQSCFKYSNCFFFFSSKSLLLSLLLCLGLGGFPYLLGSLLNVVGLCCLF